jgi:hypothetical protein
VPRRRAVDLSLLLLGVIVVVSTVGRFLFSRGVDAPWIAPDEQLYGLLGRSLVHGDGLTLLGESVPFYSLLYPLVVGLPLLVGGLAHGVTLVQALQALLMSATAIPVFLWARGLAGPRWALVAAGLSVLIPGLAYSGLLMSEALYYPLATVAVWVLAVCLRSPTLTHQALLLAAIGAALATRLQAVGFVGVVLVALVVLAVAERSIAPFRRMLPTFAVLGAVAVAWVGSRLAVGGVGGLLGGYATLTQAREYSAADIAESIAWQTGALVLITVGIPLVALGILSWDTLRGRERVPEVRALVAVGLAYVSVTVLEVSAFASRFVEHVTERQLLSLTPPVFVAFALWLRRGLPRPQPATSIVTLVLAASALLLPLDRVTAPAAYADAPSLIPLEWLSRHMGDTTFEALYAVVGAIVLLLAVLVPRRAGAGLAALVAVALASASVVASTQIRERSQTERERSFAGVPVDWIDDSGASDVTLLLTGERYWPSAWETLFWNQSITHAIRLRGTENPGVFPQDVASAAPGGALVTSSGERLEASYLAAPASVSIAGDRVAFLPSSFDQLGMILWRVTSTLRLTSRVVGLRPNGDLYGGETAVIRVFGCGPGSLELTVLGKQGAPTRLLVGAKVAAEQAIPPEGVWRPSVPAPSSADGSSICVFRLETDGLIGTTRVEWVPHPETT